MDVKHSSIGLLLLVSVITVILIQFANGFTNEIGHVEGIDATCDCGKYGKNCIYKDGAKICDCQPGFKQNGDLCERCDCRRFTRDCRFVDGKMNCTCFSGYIQKDDICVDACGENKPCINGGTCSNGVCSCREGIGGNLCQIIIACDYDQLCGVHPDTNCTYDVEEEKVLCGCKLANQVFVKDEKTCRVECKNTRDCQNGGECVKKEEGSFCKCKKGTSGDFCADAVCDEPCFVGAYCTYDSKLGKTHCKCKNDDEMPDPSLKMCRKPCKSNVECKYGAKCIESGNAKFCDCKNGTVGSFCETCEKCGEGRDVTCVASVDGGINCVCKGKEKEFDRVTKTCRKPCESSIECSYSARCHEKERQYDDAEIVEPGDRKYCRCPRGTSGDRCEIVDDCLPEKGTCGSGDDVECLYLEYSERSECKCLDGEKSFDKIDKVCKDCNCGLYTKRCYFEAGIKICYCDKGYYQINGTCEECRCGPAARSCMLYQDKKYCLCEDGYEDNGSECEKCDCGPHSDSCSFVDGKKACKCQDLYVDNGVYCVPKCDDAFAECRNGGACNKETQLCECKKGTTGTFCEDVTDCDHFKICEGSTDARCLYDEKLEEASCKCDDLHEFDEQDMKCKECYCGTFGTCSFVNGERSCKCAKNYSIKNGICTECDCGEFGSCYFTGSEKKCNCTFGYGNRNGICVACPCQDNSDGCFYLENQLICQCKKGFGQLLTRCEKCDCGEHGLCSFDGSGKKICSCNDGYFLNKGMCQKQCDDDCTNGGTCENVSGKKFCKCLPGTQGERCEIINDCLSVFQQCRGENGVCKFKVTERQAYCQCKTGTKYDGNLKMCRRPCYKDAQCSNGGSCRNKVCECPEGTSGDDCSLVDGCKGLEETCRKGGATCNFDSEKDQKAACVCENEDFVFDEERKTCTAKWCQENRCNDKATCEFDVESRAGYCKCPNPRRYYDYIEGLCKLVDPCQVKTCGPNEVCIEGKCVSDCENLVDGVCKPNFCDKKPCFNLGDCKETDIPGVVNCYCSGSLFFDGSECQFGPCIIPKWRPYCYDRCPLDMFWSENGYCEPKDEKRKCEKKDCMHGYCIKEGSKEVCKCIEKYALLKNGTCVLNANMCASKKVTPDLYKCECSGMFKYSDDGFTCERRSCKDEDVQEECRKVGATSCKDNWRLIGKGPEVGFECVCAPGFRKDINGICRETCELETHASECSKTNSICYLDEYDEPKCRCPATFSMNDETEQCEYHGENTIVLKNIPVMKQKYDRKDGSVDRILLNEDVIRSISTMYSKDVLEFVQLSTFKAVGNVLLCDVVLQLGKSAKNDIGRFGLQVMENIPCAKCEKRVTLLPPSLVLQDKNVTMESVDFCSDPVKNLLCGEEAHCADRKCFCPSGYTMKKGSLKENENYTILKCKDIDECHEGFHICTENSTCVNTPGDYYCQCLPGFKKIGELLPFQNEINKNSCVDLCSYNPCNRGQCNIRDKILDCKCDVGFVGSLCDVEDVHLKKAKNVTKIISGVLGGLLLVTIALFIVYVVRRKKTKTVSEDVYVSQRPPSEMHETRITTAVANRPHENVQNRNYS